MLKRLLATTLLVLSSLTLATTASAEECVPSPAYTETTEWVLEEPDGKGWYLVDERTIVDEEGGTVVVTEAQHYSYKGGPIEGVPLPPEEDPDSWQANTHLEPHYQGGATPANQPDGDPYTDGEGGLHYTSHQSEGLADWFYFQPEVTEEVPPVTHDEFKFARDHEAVKCDKDDPKPPSPDKDPQSKPEKYPPLAHTGFDAGTAAAAGLVLAAIGGSALWYSRKLKL
jgi:hypothetical protein